MQEQQTVQEIVRIHRRELRLTRHNLSKLSGIPPWRMRYLEMTAGACPRPREALRLAEVLGITPEVLEQAVRSTALQAEANREKAVAS